MASFSGLTLSLCIFLLLLHPPFSTANLQYKASHQLRSQSIHQSLNDSRAGAGQAPPITYFEVTKPIPLPKDKTCSYLALKHRFANTYGQLPVLASYNPHSKCNARGSSKIVLEWNATSNGKQYDQIFGVWLGGVEIFRSCTPEPTAIGGLWIVKKDVTRYYSLLTADMEQTLAVSLGNVVDYTEPGVYDAKLLFHFVKSETNSADADNKADLILPISRNLPLKDGDGLWFQIENPSDVARKELKIPRNAYRAVVEVYLSFDYADEFWYESNSYDYIYANNRSAVNETFREVIVELDDILVGAVWPFTVIYPGGINPLLWRPITGIGSFDLPTYDIELTPFLGQLLDNKHHTFGFSVTNALEYWLVDANLHLWLDKKMPKTQGQLLTHISSPLVLSDFLNIRGSNGVARTDASRTVVSIGWVRSSLGVINTTSRQELKFRNVLRWRRRGDWQRTDQTIKSNSSVDFTNPLSKVGSAAVLFRQFYVLILSDINLGDDEWIDLDKVTLGFTENSRGNSNFGSSTGTLKNWQYAQSTSIYSNGDLVDGSGTTMQDYRYSGGNSCYSRNVSSSNYIILYDEERNSCVGF